MARVVSYLVSGLTVANVRELRDVTGIGCRRATIVGRIAARRAHVLLIAGRAFPSDRSGALGNSLSSHLDVRVVEDVMIIFGYCRILIMSGYYNYPGPGGSGFVWQTGQAVWRQLPGKAIQLRASSSRVSRNRCTAAQLKSLLGFCFNSSGILRVRRLLYTQRRTSESHWRICC